MLNLCKDWLGAGIWCWLLVTGGQVPGIEGPIGFLGAMGTIVTLDISI